MATFTCAKNRDEENNKRMREAVNMSGVGNNGFKYANNKGYVSEKEIDAARYALGLNAQAGDVVFVGELKYEVISVTEDTITMRAPSNHEWRKEYEYAIKWSPRGTAKPKVKREPKAKVEEPEPQPYVAEPTSAAIEEPTETNVEEPKSTSVSVPSVDDIQALIRQMAEQSLTSKQAEIDELSNKYAAQCTELQERMAAIMELEEQLKSVREELEQAKAAGGIVPYKPSGTASIKHAQFDEVMCYVQQGRNVLLIGKAGTGKTELAKAVARALGIGFVSTGALVDKSEVTGYISPCNGTLIETCFYIAMKHGKLLLLDEYDCSFPEAAKYANEITANRSFTFPNGEVVEAHPNFRIVACANTNGEGKTAAYNAAFKLDASTKDRFEMVEIEYMYEIDLLAAGGDKELVEFAHEMRTLFDRDKLNNTYVMSPRRIAGIRAGMPLGIEKAVRNGIFNHMNADDARRIVANLRGTTKYHEAARKVVESL